MREYEPTIVAGDFLDPLEPADPQLEQKVILARSYLERKAINQSDIPLCGVLKFWLETPAKKGLEDKSIRLQNGDIVAGSEPRWLFAPKEEHADIGWQLQGRRTSDAQHLANAVEMKLELFTRNDPAAIWVKTMKWAAGKCPVRGRTEFDGRLEESLYPTAEGTADVKIAWKNKEKFPYGVLTVDHSPYKLKLSLVNAGQTRAIIARWVYLDVLVHSLEVLWGDKRLLAGARADIHLTNREKIQGRKKNPLDKADKDIAGLEELILQDLKTAHPQPTEGVVHEIKLTSNLFAFQEKGKEHKESFEKNTDFESYRDLWGNGPRIPLYVQAQIKKSDGTPTTKVPEAIGSAKILWDWEEKTPDRWKTALTAGKAPKTEPFLEKAFQRNNDAKPVALSNCPASFGGKRGDALTCIFPLLKPQDAFGFKVEPCQVRSWAALSDFQVRDGRGASVILFQPSRLAGDSYTLTGYLHLARDADSEDQIQAPPPIQTKSFQFKVLRRIQLNSLVRGRAKLRSDPSAMEADLKRDYLKELDIELEVKPSDVDNSVYKTALAKGLEKVIQREHFVDEVTSIPLLPLVARHAVNLDPPADSAGVVYRTWDDLKARLEQELKTSSVRLVTNLPPQFLSDEEITCAASGAKGMLLTVGGNRFVIWPQSSAAFKDGDQVSGASSNAVGALTLATARSCWGRDFRQARETGKSYESTIVVDFPDRTETKVQYEKHGIREGYKLKTELTQKAQDDLRTAMGDSWHSRSEFAAFMLTIHARDDSDNARTRYQTLCTYFDQLFQAHEIIDRKTLWEAVLKELQEKFKRPAQKMLALLLLGETIWEYAQLKHPGEEGVFLLHAPGLYEACNLPRETPIKQPIVMGAVFPELTGEGNSKPFSHRNRAIAYLGTLPDSQADTAFPTKTLAATFKHELAHALFIPHAPARSREARTTPSPAALCHVKGDSCLMNYDFDTGHFCGLCMMRMRGWNWQADALKNKVVSVQILDGAADAYLTANAIQYVNLPVADKWVDGVHILNKDRLWRKLKIKVEFQQEIAGQNVYLQLLAHQNNSIYSATEKTAKPSYNVVRTPAASVIGNFDQDQGALLIGVTDKDGNYLAEVELPAAVGDQYKLYAEDDDGNRVTSVEITTWRLIYYMTIFVGNNPNAVPPVTFTTQLEAVFNPEFTKLIYVGHQNLAAFPIDHEKTDIVISKLRQADNSVALIGGRKYVDFEPHLIRFTFAPSITNCRDVTTIPFAVHQFGLGAPDVTVPLYQMRPKPDGFDYRRQLWIGLGLPYEQTFQDLLTVPGNTWYIKVSVKFDDPAGTEVLIAHTNCTPIEPDAVNQPGRFSEMQIKVDNIDMPIAATKGDIVVQALFSGKMVGGWARFGLTGAIVIPALDNKLRAQPHAKQMNSAAHELGHALGMVANPKETGLDKHATHYTSQGDHCWYGLPPNPGTLTDGTGMETAGMSDNADCVMFGHLLTGVRPHPLTDFCPNCKKAMRKIDMSNGLL